MESNHPVLQQLKDTIAELEKQIEERRASSLHRANEMLANEEKLKEVLVEGINDSEITNEFAKSIADIFDIELTEEVEMELTFKVQATFTVPIGFDTDSLASDFGITENPLGVAEEYLDNSYWELDDWNITS
jgi:hypothetical protein